MMDFQEIQKQFFVSYPLKLFEWKDTLSKLKSSQQCQYNFLQSTVNHPDMDKYPVKLSYQRAFLKYIINKLEDEQCEVTEDIYNTYFDLLSISEEQERSATENNHFRHYILPTGSKCEKLILRENSNLLSSGTTGLSSWQAGAFLAEWCLSNKSRLTGCCILELGSGCGLTGLVATVMSQASQVLLTDGHEVVIEQLGYNVSLNLGNSSSDCLKRREKVKTHVNGTDVSVLQLPWSDVPNSKDLPPPDIILAADVVFDPTLFEELKDALLYLLSLNPVKSTAILSCTLRNIETLNDFIKLLEKNDLEVKPDDSNVEQVFYYDRSSPVNIYLIKLKSS